MFWMTFFNDSFNRSAWSFKLFKNKKTNGFFSIVNAKVTHLILYKHNDFFLNLQNAKMITQGHRVMNAVATFNSLDYFLLNFLFKHFRFQYTRMYERTHKTTTSKTLWKSTVETIRTLQEVAGIESKNTNNWLKNESQINKKPFLNNQL